ncbi:response regulator [Methylobacterium sp. CM6257]
MPENMLAGRRVLVVEDDYFLADETSRALKAAGATVLGPVPSVEGAFDILEKNTPDAAVLDVNLAGEMSFPIADALAASNVPFVFVTGYDQGAIPTSYAAVLWLAKPVQMSDTLREIGRLFGAAA